MICFLDNYISAFHDIYFQNAFVFTFKFVIITVIAVNAVAFATAMLVTQNIKGKNLFRSIFFMPNLVGGVLVGFAWQFIFCDVFDSVGELLGINWLCDWLSTKSTRFLGFGYSCCMADEWIYDADLHCTDTEYSGKSIGVCEN